MSRSRREFLRDAAVIAGGLAAGTLSAGGEPATGALPTRALGRTGQRVSILGFGMAPLGSDNTTPEDVTRIVGAAIDLGIRYIDAAPTYGDVRSQHGNVEMKLKPLLARRRREVFLVTKVEPGRQDRDGVLRQVEESLARLGTDHLDAVHIHNLGDFDMARVLGPDGALAGLREARRRGLIRFIGTSGHMRPARFVRAIETGEIDLTMNALNFADRANYDFEGLVLPAARKYGTAVVAMKVLGGSVGWRYDGRTQANLASYHERAIRYSLGLPGVACAVIGFNSEEEARRAVDVARAYKPLTDAERKALVAEGADIAKRRGLYYGPIDG